MPRTPPTIVAPVPRDPRVMVMAKTLNVSRADAYTAVADVWALLAADAEGDIVKGWTLEMLDAVVEKKMKGCARVMHQAGLVGVVDDGLVLPAELRHQYRAERGEPAAAAVERDGDGRDNRRKEQNRAASRKYRRKNRVTGSQAKSSGDKKWRSLGRVAGHEVRVFDGAYGCYAMMLGATVGGEPYRKVTTGDKSWSLESVRLADTLPGLLEKWKVVHQKENGRLVPLPLVPSYVDFRDDAERLTALAKYQAAEADAARHADGADASSRHADASAASAGPSADPNADGERKSCDDKGLDASSASADRHADAFSSMSALSKSSSSIEEEDMSGEGGKAAGDDGPDQGDAEPAGIAAWDQNRRRQRALAEKFSIHLGEDVETILQRWKWNPRPLRLQLEAAGIDPNTGDAINAEAPHEPAGATTGIQGTMEPTARHEPAGANVCGPGAQEFDCDQDDLRQALRRLGISSPAVQTLPDDCRELRETCHNL